MITGELKNKIDSLWDIFAAGGLVNPLEVIEQITYLMFIHDLDDSDNRKIAGVLRIPQGSVLRASAFVAPRRKAGAAQIPVQTCRTIGFHCHKIQSIRPLTIKKDREYHPELPV